MPYKCLGGIFSEQVQVLSIWRGILYQAKDIGIDQLILILVGFNMAFVRQILYPRFGVDNVVIVIIGWRMIQVDVINNLEQFPYILLAQMACELILVVNSILIICCGRCSSFLSIERLGFRAHLDIVQIIIVQLSQYPILIDGNPLIYKCKGVAGPLELRG